MKTPAFWYTAPGILATLLSPLGWGYDKVGKLLRALQKQERFSVPLISVGGITCGGSGKTPVAIALANLLQSRGHNIHFVTRGYGGKVKGPLQVNLSLHKAYEVGDEPLLLAQHAPTWVAKKRSRGVKEAIKNKADVIILDDGHQTRGLFKNISFVVIDASQGAGNSRVIPAGPLRETLQEGLARADMILALGKGKFSCSHPFIRTRLMPVSSKLPIRRLVAFCGLGFPEKFYTTLKEMGYSVIAENSFPDHYPYQEKDLTALQHLAATHDAALVTTRKDWVRLSPSWREKIHVVDIKVVFEDEDLLYDFMREKCFIKR